ncbi:hypothetical protein M885DRAFT_513540 [Pelagophyceae sp. CCMP2097]|nr:hypothetical protein M885DRAFT_513540 [Pelagophyceae sp. CCMP2097]
MVKQRFAMSDVAASVREVGESCSGWRVANIYDVSGRSFVIKFNEAGNAEKRLVMVESGVRFHVTKYDAKSGEMPSGLCAKMRAVLKGKRLSDVRVLGSDRVVDFRFGSGEKTSHLILELYAAGNIILTDADYVVVAALRVHHNFRDGAELKQGEAYPVASAACGLEKPGDRPPTADGAAEAPDAGVSAEGKFASAAELVAFVTASALERETAAAAPVEGASRKARKAAKAGVKLATLLMDHDQGYGRYGSDVIEHCLTTAGLGADVATKALQLDAEEWPWAEPLLRALSEAPTVFAACEKQESKAWLYKGPEGTYCAFSPLRLAQHKHGSDEFPSFSEAIDEYFRVVADAKCENADEGAKKAIASKVEKIRDDQMARLEALKQTEEERAADAALLELHATDVDVILGVVRSALDSGLRWDELEDYVAAEKKRGSRLACLIHDLDLEKRVATLVLNPAKQPVPVSLDMTAHASARLVWGAAKKSKSKAEKTQVAAKEVIAHAERAAAAQLARRERQVTTKLRSKATPAWFAKFAWFVTSEDHLVLAARDKMQAERLVFETMRPCDALVCGDIAGAPPCIVRAKKRVSDDGLVTWTVSPLALHEAGCFVACRSEAWTKRDRAATWWVAPSAVARPNVRGAVACFDCLGDWALRRGAKKNFLPPTLLELQFGLLFKLNDEAQRQAHAGERGDRVDLVDQLILGTAKRDDSPAADATADEEGATYRHLDIPRDIASDESPSQTRRGADAAADEARHADTVGDTVGEAVGDVEEDEDDDGDGKGDEGDDGEGDEARSDAVDAPVDNESPRSPPTAPDSEEAAASPDAEEQEVRAGGRLTARERKLLKKQGGGVDVAQLRATEAQRRRDAPPPPEEKVEKAPDKAPVVVLSAAAKKKLKKKKQNRRDDSDDEAPSAAARPAAVAKEEVAAVVEEAPKVSKTTALLDGNVVDALGRLGPLAADAWAVALSDLGQEFDVSTLAFELGQLAKLDDGVAAKALLEFARAERETNEAAEQRRVSDAAIVKRGGVAPAASDAPKRNRAALLAGIARRMDRVSKLGDSKIGAPEPRARSNAAGAAAPPPGDDDDDSYELSMLTGTPLATDDVSGVVPVCAPTAAFRSFAFSLKLTPGQTKKGRAAKDALELLAREASPRDAELIRGVAVDDAITALVANTKITSAKNSALKQARKTDDKNLKKMTNRKNAPKD